MARARRDVGERRRAQIIEAAVAVIAEEGIQHLTPKAIEGRAKMSRGQLTYYFRKMEHTHPPFFHRLPEAMHKAAQSGRPPEGHARGVAGEKLTALFTCSSLHPPAAP